MVELKQKRLRTLAPSPLQGLPSQDLQEEDWEQEDKDEDMGPRLEHSPSVQAGELKRGWNCHNGEGEKKKKKCYHHLHVLFPF